MYICMPMLPYKNIFIFCLLIILSGMFNIRYTLYPFTYLLIIKSILWGRKNNFRGFLIPASTPCIKNIVKLQNPKIRNGCQEAQNGWLSFEVGTPNDFFSKSIFWSEHSLYEKHRRQRKNGGGMGRKKV